MGNKQAIVSRSEQAAQSGPASTVLTGGSDAMVNPAAQAVAGGIKYCVSGCCPSVFVYGLVVQLREQVDA